MSSIRFAFLALEEHPYGREMLAQLVTAGHVPTVVVQEDSKLADTEREKFLDRIQGHPVAEEISSIVARAGGRLESMPVHRSKALVDCLEGLELDLVVLGGTRILRGPILRTARGGVVNSHPGLLPECRGSASPAWSVVHDIPVGATTHLCDSGIDTGDLLLRREFSVRRGMDYADLCYGTLVLAGTLMREALDAFARGEWPALRHPQGESPWPTFKNAPPDVLATVHRKLANQTYAHYVD